MRRNLAVLLAVTALAFIATGCEKLKARDNLNRGVQAYKNAQYTVAVEKFEQAVQLDPNFPTARLYLAMAYYSQYIPGADSPENQQMADHALDQFQKVLQQDPKNDIATKSIASLYYNQKKWAEAEQWYRKAIEINPRDKEGYYTLGVIAWSKWYPVYGTARAKLGMKPDDPGPIKDKKVKEELKTQFLPLLNEGIQNLQKALDIDIFLASHAGQFDLHRKYQPGDRYNPERFVDPSGYRAAVARMEGAFLAALAKERPKK